MNTNDVLIYDREAAEKWKNLFEICTPQECANLFQKPVQDGDKTYHPEPTGKELP